MLARASSSFAPLPPRQSAVGKPDIREQIEQLAIAVTKWEGLSKGQSAKTPSLESLQRLVTKFEEITIHAASTQTKKDTTSRSQVLASCGVPLSQVWSQQTRTWTLLNDLLPLQSPFVEGDNQSAQVPNTDHADRSHIDGDDLIARFANSSHDAKVMCALHHWLENNANQKYKPAEAPIVSQGHLLKTREAIKQLKRTTQTTGPLQLQGNPDAQKSLGVTSHLDPDAQTRQNVRLTDEDMTEEHRVWKQLFLFLRCGSSLDDIYQFCEGRGEVWRFLSFGLGTDGQNSRYRHLELSNSKMRLSIWRDAATQPGCDKYKAACYAILSGWPDLIHFLGQVQQDWEDAFYAYVNSWLLQELAYFAINGSRRRKGNASRPWEGIIADLNSRDSTLLELSYPLPRIQLSLVNQTFLPLARELGLQVARQWKEKHRNKLSPFLGRHCLPASVPVPSQIVAMARDPDAIQVMAHILAVYFLSHGDAESLPNEDPLFNVLIEYVNLLLSNGTYDTIPTYLRLLPMDDRMRALGFVLLQLQPDDGEPSGLGFGLPQVQVEQERVSLMKLMGSSVSGQKLVNSQYHHVVQQSDFGAQLYDPHSSFSIVEQSADEFYPGFAIRNGLIGQTVGYWEEQAIRSVALLLLTTDHWESAFGVLTRALVDFLTLGRIGAAQELTRRLSPDFVSKAISPYYFVDAIDIMKQEATRLTHSTARSGRTLAAVVADMKKQAIAYYELHQLLELVTALAHFDQQHTSKFRTLPPSAELEDENTGEIGRPLWSIIANYRPFLLGKLGQESIDALTQYYPDLLPKFESIRCTYLPQVMISSMVVLHTVAQLISSSYLSHVLLFYTELGQERNHPLMACFVLSDRLDSLKVLIARCSLTLLKLNELQDRGILKKPSSHGNSRLDTTKLWKIRSGV